MDHFDGLQRRIEFEDSEDDPKYLFEETDGSSEPLTLRRDKKPASRTSSRALSTETLSTAASTPSQRSSTAPMQAPVITGSVRTDLGSAHLKGTATSHDVSGSPHPTHTAEPTARPHFSPLVHAPNGQRNRLDSEDMYETSEDDEASATASKAIASLRLVASIAEEGDVATSAAATETNPQKKTPPGLAAAAAAVARRTLSMSPPETRKGADNDNDAETPIGSPAQGDLTATRRKLREISQMLAFASTDVSAPMRSPARRSVSNPGKKKKIGFAETARPQVTRDDSSLSLTDNTSSAKLKATRSFSSPLKPLVGFASRDIDLLEEGAMAMSTPAPPTAAPLRSALKGSHAAIDKIVSQPSEGTISKQQSWGEIFDHFLEDSAGDDDHSSVDIMRDYRGRNESTSSDLPYTRLNREALERTHNKRALAADTDTAPLPLSLTAATLAANARPPDVLSDQSEADRVGALRSHENFETCKIPITFKVFTMDDNVIQLRYEDGRNTTTDMLLKDIFAYYRIPRKWRAMFTLWMVSKELELPLKGDFQPYYVKQQWKDICGVHAGKTKPRRPVLMFRRSPFVRKHHERHNRDPMVLSLLYVEAERNVRTYRYPLSFDDYVYLCAIRVQVINVESGQPGKIYSKIRSPLALRLVSKKARHHLNVAASRAATLAAAEGRTLPPRDLDTEICEMHKSKFSMMRDPLILLLLYLQYLWQSPFYGSSRYIAELEYLEDTRFQSAPVVKCRVHINAEQLTIVSRSTNDVLHAFHFDDISWDYDEEDNHMPMLLIEYGEMDQPQLLQLYSYSAELLDRYISRSTELLDREDAAVERARVAMGGPRELPVDRIVTIMKTSRDAEEKRREKEKKQAVASHVPVRRTQTDQGQMERKSKSKPKMKWVSEEALAPAFHLEEPAKTLMEVCEEDEEEEDDGKDRAVGVAPQRTRTHSGDVVVDLSQSQSIHIPPDQYPKTARSFSLV